MRRLLTAALLLTLSFTAALAQNVPRMAKYPVAKTGCHLYAPGDLDFEMTLSEDGSEVYTGEKEVGGFMFAAIVVDFKESMAGDSPEDKTALLKSYLDFLQEQLAVRASAGYGEGHTLEGHPSAVGVIDFWEDEEGLSYSVKAWNDGDYIAVLMIYGTQEDYPYFNVWEMYANGFRFPGDE